MKVRLAILHGDVTYLNRLASILGARYPDQLTLHAFTDPEAALAALRERKIDVFLADDAFTVDPEDIPPKCGFAYFVESPEVDSVRGQPAICAFQRIELLYKQILGVFSETLGETSVRNLYSGSAKRIVFASPCGGSGTSTAAAACAVHFAAAGKRSLYLNLETFGGADAYFSGEGSAGMSDVVYAVKSRRTNLAVKLESCVRQERHGVHYFSSAKVALDMMELTAAERVELAAALTESGRYDIVVIDADFGLDADARALFRLAHAMVWVSDGLPASDAKLCRAYAALGLLEQDSQDPLTERVCVIQNKFGGEPAPHPEPWPRSAGVLPKLRHRADESILEQLAASDVFDAVLGW